MKKFYFLTLVTFANFSWAIDKEQIENEIQEFKAKFKVTTATSGMPLPKQNMIKIF